MNPAHPIDTDRMDGASCAVRQLPASRNYELDSRDAMALQFERGQCPE